MTLKKRRLKPLLVLVPLAAAVALGLAWQNSRQAAPELLFTGSVEADQIDVSPEIAGIITSVAVRDGETVKQGQPLLTLDTGDYDLKLQMARKGQELAALKASELEDGSTASQIRQARANRDSVAEQVLGAVRELDYLAKDVERLEALHEAGAASEAQLDTARRALDREQARHDGLLRQQEALDAVLAQALEGAKAQTLSAAALEVEVKGLEIQELERTLAKGTLFSPMAGVIQSVNYQAGERLVPGSKAITLVDAQRLTVKLYVAERELHRVRPGMAVMFTNDFLQGAEVSGAVTYISPKAEFTPKNIESKQSKQEMVYEVRVAIEDPTGAVKPGMFLDVLLKEERP